MRRKKMKRLQKQKAKEKNLESKQLELIPRKILYEEIKEKHQSEGKWEKIKQKKRNLTQNNRN